MKERGYTNGFNLKPAYLGYHSRELRIHPENDKADEMSRFEGMSNPYDNSIVFTISSDLGDRGVVGSQWEESGQQ